MVSENKDNLFRAPWVAIFGHAIRLVLAFNFVGDVRMLASTLRQ